MKKYVLITVFLILFFLLFNCSNSVILPDEEEESGGSVLGGWVFCDPGFTPVLNPDYNDYTMINATNSATYYGFINSLNNGNFYWNSIVFGPTSYGTYIVGSNYLENYS